MQVFLGVSNLRHTLHFFSCILSDMISSSFIEYFTSQAYDIDSIAKNWQNAVLIIAGIHLLGTVFFAIFASGELQSWATVKDEEVVEKVEMSSEDIKRREEAQADPEK